MLTTERHHPMPLAPLNKVAATTEETKTEPSIHTQCYTNSVRTHKKNPEMPGRQKKKNETKENGRLRLQTPFSQPSLSPLSLITATLAYIHHTHAQHTSPRLLHLCSEMFTVQ